MDAPNEVSAPTQRRQPVRAPRNASAASVAPARRTPNGSGRYTVATPTLRAASLAASLAPQRRPVRHAHSAGTAEARPVQPAARQRAHARAQNASRSGVWQFPANLDWPATFDDWMIDIMRRRALRLNSGARRRGSPGSVRAVELAHIVERHTDEQGRWLCAICNKPMTLADLSFDHILALADGGEHAAHNLAPTHRKCNEEKGSEKAQARADQRERWMNEWAIGSRGFGALSAVKAAPTATQSA